MDVDHPPKLLRRAATRLDLALDDGSDPAVTVRWLVESHSHPVPTGGLGSGRQLLGHHVACHQTLPQPVDQQRCASRDRGLLQRSSVHGHCPMMPEDRAVVAADLSPGRVTCGTDVVRTAAGTDDHWLRNCHPRGRQPGRSPSLNHDTRNEQPDRTTSGQSPFGLSPRSGKPDARP